MNERNIKVPTYLKEFYIDSIDYEAKNNNQINTDANTKSTKTKNIRPDLKISSIIWKNTKKISKDKNWE